MALPIIKELRMRGFSVVPLALTTAASVLTRYNVDHKIILDYVDSNNTEIRKYGNELLERHHTEGKGISVEESLAYLGASFLEAIACNGYDAAVRMYNEEGLNSFCPVGLMKDVLKSEKPDFVIATPSPRLEKATLKASYELGIPSLCMVDLFAILEMPWLKNHDNGMFLTVFSEQIKRRLVANGRRADRIFVTGNPAFDGLSTIGNEFCEDSFKKKNGIASDSKIIFWADQPEPSNPELPRKMRQKVTDIALKQGWTPVIRLHPSSTDALSEILPEGSIASPKEESLHELLNAADLIITFTSTVAMEALLLDKPVIVCKGSQYDDLVDYSAEIGAYINKDMHSLEDSMLLMLSDSKVAGELARNRKMLPKVGRATSSICNIVISNMVSDI